MADILWMTSSSVAGAYIVWKGYTWLRYKSDQTMRWEVIPYAKLSSSPWEISTSDTMFTDSKQTQKSSLMIEASRERGGLDSGTTSKYEDLFYSVDTFLATSNRPHRDMTVGSHRTAVHHSLKDDFTDRYEILTTLGRGGFGTVYKAVDLTSHEFVAVKCVHLRQKYRDLQELDMLKSVQGCSTIVRLIEDFQMESELIIVMELASGSLADIKVSLKEADYLMSIFVDIQSAVGFLHDKMIAHRDLKPDNVLMIGGKATLADFGLAQRVISSYGREIFVCGKVGTYPYMAPEVVCSSGLYSALKADVWSVGCIIYYLLTGKNLYSGRCTEHMIIQHMETVVELPECLNDNAILSSMEGSMKSALLFDPHLRPAVHML